MSYKKVSVIGGGAAGLVAAHELKKEGHEVVVFERGSQLGGLWVYSAEVESDPLGFDPNRKLVHSSLYDSVRVNIAREAMGFRDFPFIISDTGGKDSRRYPSHEEVLRYLQDFAKKFGIIELIHYQTEVTHVELEINKKWKVKYKKTSGDKDSEVIESYDAVVVCNGHFTKPRIAHNIPGIDLWPGRQIHSHNYRVPKPYKHQVVILIGLSISAVEIGVELTRFSKEVHITTRSTTFTKFGKHDAHDNLWLHPMIEKAYEDGKVSFQDGSEIFADVIIHCTGYKYSFPFLHTESVVTIDDNRVGPLYKHVFPPALAPSLSFVGIPNGVINFPLFELQSKWIAGVLSGRLSLPTTENMMDDVKAFYLELEGRGVQKCNTHKIHDFPRPYDPYVYEDFLATQCGCPLMEEWRKNMFGVTLVNVPKMTLNYRDELTDEDLVLIKQAHEDFKQYLT